MATQNEIRQFSFSQPNQQEGLNFNSYEEMMDFLEHNRFKRTPTVSDLSINVTAQSPTQASVIPLPGVSSGAGTGAGLVAAADAIGKYGAENAQALTQAVQNIPQSIYNVGQWLWDNGKLIYNTTVTPALAQIRSWNAPKSLINPADVEPLSEEDRRQMQFGRQMFNLLPGLYNQIYLSPESKFSVLTSNKSDFRALDEYEEEYINRAYGGKRGETWKYDPVTGNVYTKNEDGEWVYDTNFNDILDDMPKQPKDPNWIQRHWKGLLTGTLLTDDIVGNLVMDPRFDANSWYEATRFIPVLGWPARISRKNRLEREQQQNQAQPSNQTKPQNHADSAILVSRSLGDYVDDPYSQPLPQDTTTYRTIQVD